MLVYWSVIYNLQTFQPVVHFVDFVGKYIPFIPWILWALNEPPWFLLSFADSSRAACILPRWTNDFLARRNQKNKIFFILFGIGMTTSSKQMCESVDMVWTLWRMHRGVFDSADILDSFRKNTHTHKQHPWHQQYMATLRSPAKS